MFRDCQVVHRLYGRGRVTKTEGERFAFVRFDGEPADRRVLAKDCERIPAKMPKPTEERAAA